MRVALSALALAACAGSSSPDPAPDPGDGDWVRHGESLLTAGSDAGDGKVEIVIADPDLLVDADGTWHLWYQGSRASTFTAPDLEMWVRHATSEDGIRFVVDAEPVITTPSDDDAWDATHTETPAVVEAPTNPPERRFVMAYSGASTEHPLGFPHYQVGVAFSADGRTFTRPSAADSPYGRAGLALVVRDALADVPGITDGVIADPDLVWDGERLHLFYSGFAHDADLNFLAFGIGHAISDDGGLTWTPEPARPVPSLLAADGVGGQQPSVAYNPVTEGWEMTFTDDEDAEREAMPSTFNPSMGFWRATSPDLTTWTVDWEAGRDLAWDPDAPGEELGLLTGAALAIHGGERRIYYTGWGDEDVPDGFVVPTHDGVEPAVLSLLLATRGAAD